jgi:hypothetical protein
MLAVTCKVATTVSASSEPRKRLAACCSALLLVRLLLLATSQFSTTAWYAEWREHTFCAARLLDGALLVPTQKWGLVLASQLARAGSAPRWGVWVNYYLLQVHQVGPTSCCRCTK